MPCWWAVEGEAETKNRIPAMDPALLDGDTLESMQVEQADLDALTRTARAPLGLHTSKFRADKKADGTKWSMLRRASKIMIPNQNLVWWLNDNCVHYIYGMLQL